MQYFLNYNDHHLIHTHTRMQVSVKIDGDNISVLGEHRGTLKQAEQIAARDMLSHDVILLLLI